MEKWMLWKPLKNISGKFYIHNIEWLKDGFKINMFNKGKSQKVEVFVDSFIGSLRYTEENYCYSVLEEVVKNYNKDFYHDWSFFKVENSKYLAWMNKYSGGMSDFHNIKHYCILGGDQSVDILLSYEPEVTVTKQANK